MNDFTDLLTFEKMLWKQDYQRVMGLDEVGRGCLCGPVVAAGVIFKPGHVDPAFADSKKIPGPRRVKLAKKIKQQSLFWTIQHCNPQEIDEINILRASMKAMLNCSKAGGNPDYLLVDGNRFTSSLVPYSCLVKGDARSSSIGAASILAKVYRDHLMVKLHEDFPCFGWDKNVGYPTRQHYEALKKYGYTKHHRKSFSLKTDKVYSPTGNQL